MKPIQLLMCSMSLLLAACQGQEPVARSEPEIGETAPKSEVLVLGMIHSGHRDSPTYGIDVVREIVRAANPDFILAEIPPDRLEAALESYRATGVVREARVERFPEYTDAIIPLMEELGFEIIPCAAWTKEMALDRQAKLSEWKESRPAQSKEVERAQVAAEAAIEAAGLDSGPRGIHSDEYDALVKEGLEPYNRLFGNDLGLGGWANINAAHYALIEQALNEHRGEGRRFMIAFGSWHKYWFLEQLRERDDVRFLTYRDVVGD